MSATPKTDDNTWTPRWDGMGSEPEPVVDASFARELERELNDVRAHQAYDTRLLEALGRHVAFQVHEPDFPAFAMIDPETRRSMSTPLRVELEFFLRECFGERFEDGK